MKINELSKKDLQVIAVVIAIICIQSGILYKMTYDFSKIEQVRSKFFVYKADTMNTLN